MEFLNRLLSAVESVTGVSADELRCRERTLKRSLARGCYFHLAHQNNSLTKAAKFIDRRHSTASITAKRYRGYIEIGDREITRMIDEITKQLDTI